MILIWLLLLVGWMCGICYRKIAEMRYIRLFSRFINKFDLSGFFSFSAQSMENSLKHIFTGGFFLY